MTGPVLISPKVTPIEAYQFTGGTRDASALSTWLDSKLSVQSRRGAIAVQFVAAVAEVIEGEGDDAIIVEFAAPEYVAIFTTGGRHRVEVGNWIILDPVSLFRVVGPDTIAADYDIEGTV